DRPGELGPEEKTGGAAVSGGGASWSSRVGRGRPINPRCPPASAADVTADTRVDGGAATSSRSASTGRSRSAVFSFIRPLRPGRPALPRRGGSRDQDAARRVLQNVVDRAAEC